MKRLCSPTIFWLAILLLLCPTLGVSQLVREWAVTYDGSVPDSTGYIYSSWDHLQEMLVDRDGNIILVGETNPAPFEYSLTTVKYNPQGKQLWKYDIPFPKGPVSSDCQMAVDGKGNVFLAYAGVVGDSAGWVVRRFSPEGNLTRTFIFPITNDITDWPQAIAIDTAGNIILTGKTNAGGLQWDCATMKADSGGNLLWTRLYDSGGWDDGLEMSLDDSSNILVAAVGAGFGTDDDIVTLKYDQNGELCWAKDYNGGGLGWTDDWPVSIQTDTEGNVYVTGYSQPSESAWYGIATLKYARDGKEMWCRRIEDALIGCFDFSSHHTMHVDNVGNVYLTGCTDPDSGSGDLLTCKYSTDGSLLWKTIYPDSVSGDDLGKGITVTPSGHTVVAGEVYETLSAGRYPTILCYDTAGTIVGRDIYHGNDSPLEKWAYSVAVGPDGSVYLSGMDEDWVTGRDFLLIKYSFAVTGVKSPRRLFLPDGFALAQNFPNPFNPTTVIQYELPRATEVTLEVCDMLGREVSSLVNAVMDAGYHEATFDASGLSSGMYFYRLRAGEFVSVKTMMILR